MNENDELFFNNEEEHYHQLLRDAVSKSESYPTDPDWIKRLNDELDAVHYFKKSKAIWFGYLIAKKAQEDNEDYFIRNTIPDLYLVYVLGVTKVNPITDKRDYRVCLGTKNSPSSYFEFDFSVRKGYEDTLRELVKSIEPDSKIYFYTLDKISANEENLCSPTSVIVIPNSIEIDKHLVIGKHKYYGCPIAGEAYEGAFNLFVRFNILGSNKLSLIYKMRQLYGATTFDESFNDFIEAAKDKDYISERYVDLIEHLGCKSFVDAVRVNCIFHNVYKEYDVSKYSFVDRESVFNYFIDEIGMPEDQAFKAMENVRRGRFKQTLLNDAKLCENIPIKTVNDLCNIRYLFPKGHEVEDFYVTVQSAHYFRYHTIQYLRLQRELNE